MGEITSKSQMEKIRNFEKGFFATHLINIGEKLGLFEVLLKAKDGMSVSDLAVELKLHEPYLKVWCQTAYFFEILGCDNLGRFRLQPFLDEILGDKTHFKNYLANISLSVNYLGNFFEIYPELFRSGMIGKDVYTQDFSKAAYEPTKNIYLVFLFMIFPKNDPLKQMLERGVKLLDIGCGNGNLTIQLAQAFKKSTFVGIDPVPHGIEEAKSRIVKLGLEERVSFRNLGAEDISSIDEFDLAVMAVTLHEIPPGIRGKVLEKAYHALKSSGQLLILDFPYPSKIEEFRNPMYDFGILDQFFEVCGGFTHLNMNEQNEMLDQAGFKNIQRMNIGKGMFEFITATK